MFGVTYGREAAISRLDVLRYQILWMGYSFSLKSAGNRETSYDTSRDI